MSYIPLNGDSVIEKVNGELERCQTPATVLRDALASANEEAPDGTNGAVKSGTPQRATDPTQGAGWPGKAQRPDPLLDALLKAVY
ncbi:hypothetical protein RAE13_07055 [Corynebacterium curieae]|uniref:Uncharacterized protein n=1 Tax=Corynebacterium curieae TaxID=2913500 RepID=A0ABU3W7X9_9CORY|nr:hypothetical protein [Corynebacterium curieae]MDV2424165.1 hypothetical protein [Corynebacterium curieae]